MTSDAATPPAGFLVRAGNWFFKYRNYVFPLFLAAVLIGLPPVPLAGDAAADRWLDTIGVAIALAGSAFRFWVIGLAYIKRGGVNKQVFADKLVTSGLFGVCRNPLYVGNALVLLGIFLVHNNPWLYVLGLAFFGFAYAGIVAAEEGYLRTKFGEEYARYCADVPRFWPRFARYAAATEGMSFDWRRAILKDHGSVYAWIVTIVAIELIEHHGTASFPATPWWPDVAVFAAATAALLLIRVLKKSGRLAARA